MYLTKVSAGFAEGEFRHVDRIGPVRQGELDGRIVELLDMRAAAFIILNFLHADNLKQRIHLQLLLERVKVIVSTGFTPLPYVEGLSGGDQRT